MPILNDGVVAGPTPLIPQPSYMTVFDADDYFSTRLNSDVWNNATPQNKLAALITATRAIDLLNFVGVKADGNQPLQFPRARPYPTLDFLPVAAPVWIARPLPPPSRVPGNWPPGSVPPPPPIPVEILIACCEEAIVRLDGVDVELEITGVGVNTDTYAGVRESYDRTVVFEGLRAGIVSNVAWNFLVPWLADGQAISLSRV